jgi:competence protein ComEC
MAREGIDASAVVRDASAIHLLNDPARGHRDFVERVRDHIRAFIDQRLEYPEREEMRALIIGDRGGIDQLLRDKFALTGMAHLLVISGLHLGFVAAAAFGAARMVCWMFPLLMIRGWANKICAIAAAVAVLLFFSIAGRHVSTIRALIMVLSYAVAVVLDRPREVMAALALAAIGICLGLPGSTADIGFQLSFASVLSIVLGMRLYSQWRRRYETRRLLPARRTWPLYRLAGAIGAYVAVSFWALLGTAPLTAYHFNQFSLVGLIANAVVVPIMGGGGMICGLLAAVLSFFYLPLASIVLRLASVCLMLGTFLAGTFAALPGAWIRTFTPTPLELLIAYLLLMLWLIRPAGKPSKPAAELPASEVVASKRPPSQGLREFFFLHRDDGTIIQIRWRSLAAASLLLLALLDAGWWTYRRFLYPDLRITFLSVGQGDGAVVEFPRGRVMLIDGGGAFGDEFDPGERIVAHYLWSHKIMSVDYLLLSHPELDHFGGFRFVTRNFKPREFWTINATSPDIQYLELLADLATAGTHLKLVDSTMPQRTIGGVRLSILNPAPGELGTRNNSSMVVALDFGNARALFTGDLEARGEQAMLDSGANVKATLLKVPHHGSKTSSSVPFIEAVAPRYAVISLGYNNRYHFPAPVVLERYRSAGTMVLRTDQDGAVTAELGRTGMRVWSVRGGSAAAADRTP